MITDPFIPKLQEAQEMTRRGQFGKAIAIYSEILHRDPYHAAAQRGLSQLKPYLSGPIEPGALAENNIPTERKIKISRDAPSLQSIDWGTRVPSQPFLKKLDDKGLLKYGGLILLAFVCMWGLLGDYRSEYAAERAKDQAVRIGKNQSPFLIPEMDPMAIWEEALRFEKEGLPLYAFYRARHLTKLDRRHGESVALVASLGARLNQQAEVKMNTRELSNYLLNQSFTELRAYSENWLARSPDDPKALALHAQVLTGLAQAAFKSGNDQAAETFLKLGRAVFPNDLIWDVRLIILHDLHRASSKEREEMLGYFG